MAVALLCWARMVRTLILGLLLASLLNGCANGWPRARHPLRGATVAGRCVPTTSRIDRKDCATTAPGGQQSGADLDRTGGQYPGNGPMNVPVQSKGF